MDSLAEELERGETVQGVYAQVLDRTRVTLRDNLSVFLSFLSNFYEFSAEAALTHLLNNSPLKDSE